MKDLMNAGRSVIPLVNLRLLVVEAELEAQAEMVSALQACGAEVMTANSVATGLAALSQQRPDLMISDLHFPDGDGCSFLQIVRQQEAIDQMAAVPAIAVSASAKTVNLEQVIAVGFKRYLAKPIQLARLVDMIATLTDRAQVS